MDDPLGDYLLVFNGRTNRVLIPILMDDPLGASR